MKKAITLALVLAVSVPVVAAEKELAQPTVITAPANGVPSDAIVLLDGKSLSEWTHTDGNPVKWKLENGAMVVAKGNGGVITKKEFGDIQLHLEFSTPADVVGDGQGRGNSGVYFQGCYEVQVLDSYKNETYADGMLGAVYQQYVPLVNAARKPGEWQTYDIIFRAPVLNQSGAAVKRATATVFLNGVLIQDHIEIQPTPGGPREKGAAKGPIYLQDHGNPVKYRNIWVREL